MDSTAVASTQHLEAHRPALTGHCYRMLGSIAEAEDAVQETLIRAWKNLDRFEHRAALRTWLYRIATRVCLDSLEHKSRREKPTLMGPPGTPDSPLQPLPDSRWVEPIPDGLVIPTDADPAERAMLRQSVRLAFVAALQHLPPKQRAVLLLTEVLGWSAAETAEATETSVASVNSALQRARATLSTKDLSLQGPLPEEKAELLAKYVQAFEAYDIDGLARLLRDDAKMSMPPFDLWLQGPAHIGAFMLGPGAGCKGSRLLPVQANGMAAYAHYKPSPDGGPHVAWALMVLDLSSVGDKVTEQISFLDVQRWFPKFGMPLTLPA